MFIKRKNKKINNKNAFTLVEMLVSIAIFTVVTTIAFTALYTIMNASEKAKIVKTVVNNLNIAMESMSREIRVGYDYCNNSVGTGCDSSLTGFSEIFFTDKNGCNAEYFFDDANGAVKRTVRVFSGGSCAGTPSTYAITGEDIKITDLKFFINGTDANDNFQPRVLIILRGEMTRANIDTKFDIQTTISQRNLAP